jgi:hypothetical protein
MSSNDPPSPLPPDVDATAAPTVTPASPLPLLPMPTDPAALVEVVARGLAPDAEPAVREAAWQIWTRFSPMIGALVRSMPGGSAAPAPMIDPAAMPEMMPTARLSPEQLGDALIATLRARLPQGTALPPPRGFQIQMVKPK